MEYLLAYVDVIYNGQTASSKHAVFVPAQTTIIMVLNGQTASSKHAVFVPAQTTIIMVLIILVCCHTLTLCILMDSSFWVDSSNLGIVHCTYLGVSGYNFQKMLYYFV